MTGDREPAQSRIGTRHAGSKDHPLLRPKDAASIILIDRSSSPLRILVGKRGKAHAFMPNVYVFPGGRRDRNDGRVACAKPLRADVEARLMRGRGVGIDANRARALAVAAIRETMEEAGLLIGGQGAVGRHPDWRSFADAGLTPDLSPLRYIARAITPPRQSRRFDTRFFACFLDETNADPADISDSEELHDLTWMPLGDTVSLPLPRITQSVLDDLRNELDFDPALAYGRPVPFYTVRHGIFVRDMI